MTQTSTATPVARARLGHSLPRGTKSPLDAMAMSMTKTLDTRQLSICERLQIGKREPNQDAAEERRDPERWNSGYTCAL